MDIWIRQGEAGSVVSGNDSERLAFFGVDRSVSACGTHYCHKYPMRFIPQLARQLILDCSLPGNTILDPFVGSGTVLVEVLLLGRNSIGIDINPLAPVISAVKIQPHNPARLDQTIRAFV
ncbi:MAG: DNA methyltransferase [Thermaerobacter sp.]|jgi:DNA modification methylase|nr:DNA methyltransferase [Thermaerobacter sp.]